MELELKHLSPYLPYELGIYQENSWPLVKFKLNASGGTGFIGIGEVLRPSYKYMPILRPMSDLNREHSVMLEINEHHTCEYNGKNTFVDLENECNYDPYSVEYLPHACFEILIKYHFDAFDLIKNNLAIDINTLKNEESEAK